jgi:replication factor C subunit 2/4
VLTNTDNKEFFNGIVQNTESFTNKLNINSFNNENKERIPIKLPWVEKYRPKHVNELLINDTLSILLNSIVESKKMQNIILVGPPGVGKTSTIKALVKDVLKNNFKTACLLLGTAEDRGIKIKEMMEMYCKNKISMYDENGNELNGVYKIIVLDEVDNMSEKAQQGICDLMEEYKNKVKFGFTCNDSEKIINIQQKCNIIRYSGIPKEKIIKRLKEICDKENVKYDARGIELITKISNGDMRQALNNLEIVSSSYGVINEKSVLLLCDIPNPEDVIQMIKYCHDEDFDKVYEKYLEFKHKGHSNVDILQSLIDYINETDCKEDYKIKFMEIVSNTFMIVQKGISTPLQMTICFYRLIYIPKQK